MVGGSIGSGTVIEKEKYVQKTQVKLLLNVKFVCVWYVFSEILTSDTEITDQTLTYIILYRSYVLTL